MLYRKILQVAKDNIEAKIGKEINEEVLYNSLLFTVASVIGIKRLKVEDNYINFIGITFGRSGVGKDLSLKVFEDALEPLQYYIEIINKNKFTENENSIIPNAYKIPLLGTLFGAMRVANFLQNIEKGSLNIVENEFGSVMNRQITDFITKLWQDGSSMGSINVNEKYPPIKNLPTNSLLFGTLSPFERDDNKYHSLVETLETGFARRAFIINVKLDKINEIDKVATQSLDELFNPILEHIRTYPTSTITLTKEAKNRLIAYRKKLIEDFNNKPTDWNNIRVSNVDKVLRVSAIIALINMHMKVEEKDVLEAIKLANISDKHLLSIIKPKQPYMKMFEHLKIVKSKFKTELLDELGIKLTKTQLNEQIEMLKEYAYRNNYELKITDMMVHLMPLKDSSLDEIIVSVNMDGKKEEGITTKNIISKFFGSNGKTIETLVTSTVDWFSFVHYNGTRKQKNVIPEFNVIAFDIDDSLLLDDAIALLLPYTYIIYTTRNHQKEKKGIIADRYRIILPLKRVINLDVNRYKEFVRNVATLLRIKNEIDYSTVEMSRLWFSNPDAKLYKNVGELLDPICCIPETKTEEKVRRVIKVVANFDEDNRINGITTSVLSHVAINGKRNDALHWATRRLSEFKSKEETREIIYRINDKLRDIGYEPLNTKEIDKTMMRSAFK
jgi:hypothetical protein